LPCVRKAEIDRRLPFTGDFIVRHDTCPVQRVPKAQLEHPVLVGLSDPAVVADAGKERRRPGLVTQFIHDGLHKIRLILRKAVPEIFDRIRHVPTLAFS
jgi:hypothetical protein